MSERRVYLAQLKCPSGHCIIAAAGEFPSDEAAQGLADVILAHVAGLIARGLLNPYCGICRSDQLHVSIGRTAFASVQEAAGPVQACEAAQAMTREFLKRSRN